MNLEDPNQAQPKTAAEQARFLNEKAAKVLRNKNQAVKVDLSGVFGLNQQTSLQLDLQIGKQLRDAKSLEQIDQKIKILEHEMEMADEQQDKTQLRALKSKFAVLDAKRTAINAQKQTKFDMLHERVTTELQKRFELEKMNTNFKKDLAKDARRLFKRAENLGLDKKPDNDPQIYKFEKKENGEVEITQDTITKLKVKKQINQLEQEQLAGGEQDYGLLLFDDLKYATVASGKLIREGNLEREQQIRKGVMKKRSIRKVLFDDDNLSDLEENFNERDDRIEAGEMKPRKNKKDDEISSDAVSEVDSRASRVNFWKDINTKDDEYKDAVFVAKDNIKKDEFVKQPTQTQDMIDKAVLLQAKQQSKKHMAQAQDVQKKAEIDKIYYQQKIEKMKMDFEIIKTNIKKQSTDYAAEYFKNKSFEMSNIYTGETIKLLKQYTLIRNDSLRKDEVIKNAFKIVSDQEQVISELRMFIHANLIPILDLVEREREKIYSKYDKLNKMPIPNSMKEDPFAMFGFYCACISEKVDKQMDKDAKKMQQLQDIVQSQQAELKVVHDATELLLKDGLVMEEKLRVLKGENQDLKTKLEKKIKQYDKDVKERDQMIQKQKDSFSKQRRHMLKMAEIEQKVSSQIQRQYQSIQDDLKKKLRHVKNVLRTPRLNQYFRDLMLQSHSKETLKEYLMSKLKREDLFSTMNDDQISEEEALVALRTAIQVNLTTDTEADELISENDVKPQGMLSGRHQEFKEIYTMDNINTLNIAQLLKSQKQIQQQMLLETAPLTPTYSPQSMSDGQGILNFSQTFQDSQNPLFSTDLEETFSSRKDYKISKLQPKIVQLDFNPNGSRNYHRIANTQQISQEHPTEESTEVKIRPQSKVFSSGCFDHISTQNHNFTKIQTKERVKTGFHNNRKPKLKLNKDLLSLKSLSPRVNKSIRIGALSPKLQPNTTVGFQRQHWNYIPQ